MAKKKSSPKKRKKGLVIKFTPFSSFLWTIGLLFVLAWVFVLGFFMGRGFLPGKVTAFSDMKTRLKRIQTMMSRDKMIEETSREKEEENPKLAFYERLSSKKNEVKKQWQESTKDESIDNPVSEAKSNIPSQRHQVKESKPSSNQSIEKREGSSSASDHYYTIQLASLKEGNRAEELVDRLIRKGYSVYYYEVEVKGQIYYRVRYGRFSTREEAEEQAQRLARKEKIKGFVTTLD